MISRTVTIYSKRQNANHLLLHYRVLIIFEFYGIMRLIILSVRGFMTSWVYWDIVFTYWYILIISILDSIPNIKLLLNYCDNLIKFENDTYFYASPIYPRRIYLVEVRGLICPPAFHYPWMAYLFGYFTPVTAADIPLGTPGCCRLVCGNICPVPHRALSFFTFPIDHRSSHVVHFIIP